MNHLLSKIVGVLNGFLALVFIIIGATLGNNSDAGIFIGIIGGVVAAVIFCGVLAVFISMRDELINIRKLLDRTDIPNESLWIKILYIKDTVLIGLTNGVQYAGNFYTTKH